MEVRRLTITLRCSEQLVEALVRQHATTLKMRETRSCTPCNSESNYGIVDL
jgi:hypothetical protein